METGADGAGFTVKVPVAENAVSAAVVGEASPWAERTRQNFCPGVSEISVRLGSFCCGTSSSICLKPESLAICNSYPLGCGLATSVHASVIGSVSVEPFAGVKGDGGPDMGLL